MSSSLTFTDKEVRKFEKKARQKEQKYRATGELKFLQERDEFLDKSLKLRENRLVDRKSAKRKVAESQKTDDQLLNEALRQNRRERNDAEKKRKIQMEKEANLKELRCSVKETMKTKNEEKMKFMKKYQEENPKDSAPDSQLEKMFTRHYKDKMEFLEWKNKMISLFMSLGMTEEYALKELQKMIDHHQSKDTEDPIPGEEVSGIQTIIDKEEVEQEIMLEDPIPEEEIVHWCTHEDCIESIVSFETEDSCMEHLQKEHLQINENPRL